MSKRKKEEWESIEVRIREVLRLTFGSQYTDEFQQGKVALAEQVADILGWDE